MSESETSTATLAPSRDPGYQALLDRLFHRMSVVSSLPSVAIRILETANDEETTASDILEIVEADPALAIRILRTVNSAYYSLRNQVRDLKSAIGLLGLREVRNLALTVYVARMFQNEDGYRGYSRQGLWTHLVGVASAARLISQEIRRGSPEELYLAGLLHDVGYILTDQFIQNRFRQVIDELTDEIPTRAVERRILTFDHTEVGAYATRKWDFPEGVVDAIRYHHNADEYDGPHRDVVSIIAVANSLCTRKGSTALGVSNVAAPKPEVFNYLGIERTSLSKIWDQLEETLEQASIVARM